MLSGCLLLAPLYCGTGHGIWAALFIGSMALAGTIVQSSVPTYGFAKWKEQRQNGSTETPLESEISGDGWQSLGHC